MTTPTLTPGPATLVPPGQRYQGQYAVPLLRPDGSTETTIYGPTADAAMVNATMLAKNPAYLARVRPQ